MDIEKIGKYLAELRKDNGYSQEELGEKIGVTNKTVSRWETGKYMPPVDALQALSDLYGITINEILSGKKLSEEEYKEQAEENIKVALSSSKFTLQERKDFFKKKWEKENSFEMTVSMIVIIGIMIAGIILDNGLLWIGIIIAFSYTIYEYNRMMAFVEKYAFDGGKEKSNNMLNCDDCK